MQRRRAEVRNLEGRVQDLVRGLEQGRKELEELVDVGRGVRKTIKRGETGVYIPIHARSSYAKLWIELLPVGPLLAHARSLARHSSAPVSSLLAPIDKAQYQPWPTETAMRGGILFREGGSMSGIGDVGHMGEGE